MLYIACCKAHRCLAACLCKLALQLTHAALPCIEGNHRTKGRLVDAQGVFPDAVRLLLLGQQVSRSDLHLFLVRIAGKLNDLHTVKQRTRNGVGRVGGRDEQNAAQIDRDLQIMIAE